MADWSQVAEILSVILHGSSPETTSELCKLVDNGSSDILNKSNEFEEYFSSLVALSAHVIGLNVAACKGCLPHALSACNVVLQFCLARITKERDKLFSKKNLISIIEGLCKGHGCLDRTEVTTFMAVLKVAKYPKNQQQPLSAVTPEQFDIYQQLTGTYDHESFADLPFPGHPVARHMLMHGVDIKTSLSNGNVSTLREMQGGKVLLDLCVSLPNISQFMALRGMEDLHPSMKTVNNLSVSSMMAFSSSRVHELASEINLICSIASIPVMEPLNSYRLNKITLLALGCVDVAMYAASGSLAANSSDEGNHEEIAQKLVNRSLSVVDVISHILATSHRAGGHILQNFNLLISHCILKGLSSLLKLEPSTELKTKEKDVNKTKRLQGFNVLLVELSKKVISIMSSLFEDLKLECGSEEDEVDIPASGMTIEVQVSAWHRIKQLLRHISLVPLLMKLFTHSYSKANALVESVLLIPGTANTEATKFASDDVETKSDNSNEDSTDSDFILGNWFMMQEQEGRQSPLLEQDDGTTWKSEGIISKAELYLEMSQTILAFVGDYMLNKNQTKLLSNVQKSLQPLHLKDLASIVLDLDGPKNRMCNLNGYYPFCESLNRYLHILLGCNVLSEEQQGILLTDLSLSPVRVDCWPLYVGPRSLSILARVLLGRQQKNHRTKQTMDDSSCVEIWEKLIQTLKENALKNDSTSPDLNVEQLQLLLIVWHNFSKAQRDKIQVLCIRALYDISTDNNLGDKVPLYAYRLLQILDYILHQYSGPPKELLTQIQYNLFKTKIGFPMAHMEDELIEEPRVLFFQNAEREESVYHKASTKDGPSHEKKTPRFYGLRPSEADESELKDDEVKRLLFALNEDGLNYQRFYDTLITLLSAGSNCDILMRKKIKTFTLGDSKIVRCMFGMCWRLVVELPPPVAFVRDLQQNRFFEIENYKDLVDVLVRLYWSVKVCDPKSQATVKANLIQQHVLKNDASRVIANINTRASNVSEVLKEGTWYLQQILDKLTCHDETTTPDGLPGLFTVIALDSVLTRVYVTLRDLPDITDADIKTGIQKLLPVVLDSIKFYQAFARFSLLFHHTDLNDDASDVALESEQETSLQDVAMYSKVIKIGSSTMDKPPVPSIAVVAGLPISVQEMIEKWNSLGSVEFLPLFSPEHILNEGVSDSPRYIAMLLSSHMKVMSFRFAFNLDASIRHVVQSMVLLTSHLLTKYPKEENSIHTMFTKEITDAIVPLTVDASAEFLYGETNSILENVFGSSDSEDCASSVQQYLLGNCYELMIEHSLSERPALCEDVLVDSLRLIESLLDRPKGRSTLQQFYQDNEKFVSLLLLSANQNFSLSYVHRMLKFVCRTLEMYEKQPSDSTTLSLVQSISWLSDVNQTWLNRWLSRIIVGGETDKEMTGKMADNRLLLQSIVTFLVKEQSPISGSAIDALLDSMIPLGTQLLRMATDDSIVIGSKFVDFLSISSTLAGFADGYGHLKLMKAVILWLQTCKNHLNSELIVEGKNKENSLVECTNVLLAHVADVLAVLKETSDEDELMSPNHGESDLASDVESDGVDDEDESAGEESEEDTEGNQLWNKLCTFTTTRKEFANQHWYHCHTCKMNDGVGVCTICAKVCHKNHDVTYAKYGSFFCDCGAKEDDSCKAMKKRSPQDSVDSAGPEEKVSTVSSYRRPQQTEKNDSSAEGKNGDLEIKNNEKSSNYELGQPVHRRALRRQLEPNRKALINLITDEDMCKIILGLLNTLSSMCDGSEGNALIGGARKRIAEALEDLHKSEKTVENNELLLVPTLGSQEGAFENVKLVCSGEQGQAIRQLLGTHVLRRVAMCCLTSAKGRRQHLAVSHEKGKITILQLSTLLKQADSSRRKLTLTRLATTQVPFTILSLTGNICNEDFLAVCGLKDCHVLTLSGSGSVVNHLALHPQLESSNFIIKAIWLPGSQTELAIVTADFVKIYDLAKDAFSPLYYFVLPAGKVRDVSFIFLPLTRLMALMSSGGQIYSQPLDESSSAKSGPFYLTNIIPVEHGDLVDTNGQVCGGGVSIYYSHGFQLLFFSYVQGKTFVASWTENLTKIDKLFPIAVKTTNGNKTAPVTLCQWSEVPQHPGLILCLTYTTCAPMVLMVKPDHISFQEIKSASSKSKIQDVVAIRHSLSNSDQSRTTVILLCEDGSLKIYMASHEQAGFWMSPVFQPSSVVAALKPIKQRKPKKSVHKPSSSPHFPIDFFEQCQILNDVEYGGKDVLQVYNVQQVKHRLMTAGMYIACNKQNSFSLTITNCNPSIVMVGIRVLIGCQVIDKAPTYVEAFGRVVDVELKRNRWFDIPFTREEVLSTDRTITLTLGQSHDTGGVTMLDSIKVYGKTKEAFGWPDDLQDEGLPPPTPSNNVPTTSPFSQSNEIFAKSAPLSLREIMTANSLRALDGFVSLVNAEGQSTNQEIVNIATSLLSSPLPHQVQEQAKTLLASLHPSKIVYNNHKDEAQLTYVVSRLYDREPVDTDTRQDNVYSEMDPEIFERLVVMTRAVAVNRPENLVRFTNELAEKWFHDASIGSDDSGQLLPFPEKIMATFWKFYKLQPCNSSLVTVASSGMHHTEMTVFALVEILHAFIVTDNSYVPVVTELYAQMLLCPDVIVSFSCKQSLIYLLRPACRRSQSALTNHEETKTVGNPPEEHLQFPNGDDKKDGVLQGSRDDGGESRPSHRQQQQQQQGQLEQEEDISPPAGNVPEPGQVAPPSAANRLEALLGGGFPGVYELPPDADDEAMMELAIALSLQEQGEEAALDLHHFLGDAIQNGEPVGEGEQSSSSASGHASEDDLEPGAGPIDDLQMRGSPQPAVLSQGDLGSVSEGSVESISGENQGDEPDRADDPMESGVCATPKPDDQATMEQFGMSNYDEDAREKLHMLNIVILDQFIDHFPKLDGISGVQAIPFMQVLLVLCSDLDNSECNSDLLDRVLYTCLRELHLESTDLSAIGSRSSTHEVQLIVMRFLSVLMSKSKSSGKASVQPTSSMSARVAGSLWKENIMDHCLKILNRLMEHWKLLEKREEGEGSTSGRLLKPQPNHSPPDMSPFFLRQYVKSHASDVFEAYPLLVTEMVLRLSYQVKKIADSTVEGEEKKTDLRNEWFTCLFEYMMIQQTSFVKIKRQVRKLLLFLCGSKEIYREQRDSHALDVHFKAVRHICGQSGFNEGHSSLGPISIEYDTLLLLIEHLKAAAEIASSRTKNWQTYCLRNNHTLSFLFKVSFLIDEGVTGAILQLLTTALCENGGEPNAGKEKDKVTDEEKDKSVLHFLVQQLNESVDVDSIRQFVRCFLLQSNSSSIRWHAHSLLYSIQRNSDSSQQDKLSDMMWSIWPELPGFGRKATQFVDLLGFFTIKRSLSEEKASEFSEKAVCLLRKQNEILRNHPNSNVYRLLSGLVDFDGFYLESDPCLVCNNPEVPYSINKLSAIKTDARFSTTCQMVKLVSSFDISRVSLRISDVKRQKMVKTINLYYNNRSVQSVVELKNKTSQWQKAKKCHLLQGQTDLKIDFPLPIVACNLMIEYADFYENIQASSETLQCPRCSAAVAASPGICGNCGENVYQCHKCRSINYDEKDPFLCNACGFCKYAKFDVILTAKPCCTVDPIENEEDRKKAVTNINTLLERADKMYRQLVAHRQPLDSLLMKVLEEGDNDMTKSEPSPAVTAAPAGSTSVHTVHKTIQAVAQRYCVDCKSNFDELSKIIQKVLASRKELIEYDNRVRESPLIKNTAAKEASDQITTTRSTVKPLTVRSDAHPVPGRCYGCSSAATEHCVTLLKALAMKPSTRDTLIKEGLILELVNHTLYQGTSSIRNNVRDLLCLLTRNNPDAADELNTILVSRVTKGIKEQTINPSVSSCISRDMQLLTKTVTMEDCCWEQRLRCVTRVFLLSVQHASPIVVQTVTLPCLKILSQFITPKAPSSKANLSKSVNDIASVKGTSATMTNMREWINEEEQSSYLEWVKRVSVKPPVTGLPKKQEPQEIEYKPPGLNEVDLNEAWLRHVMFSPSCGALRQVACSVVEAICQIPGRKLRIMNLLTSYLDGVGGSGENCTEFFNLYFELMKPPQWKRYLASSGALMTIGNLVTKEIEHLAVLEETTLSSDLSQGYALKRLTELMASFIEHNEIKQEFKGKLVGAVLNGYLSLRRLVVQRTKLVDQSQEVLLLLLGELTSGTESETREFMSICVNTLNRYELDDLRTPVFIFERLCNIIYPEENDIGEFLLMLEKDPQQEDFLQGRMQGNPYRSTDTGMGPLMRDVKNKICTDCDLIALLEDDTGMELLVNSKIISLDLPVKEVYKKIWCLQGEGEPMKIVYRMRGLLGDATEDIVEQLDKNNEKNVDNESVYKMANVMSECSGLEALLTRLSSLRDLVRGHQLLEVILKLFSFCVKVKANREYLANPSLKTLKILLDVLNQVLHVEQDGPTGIGNMAEQILSIIEALLQGAGTTMKLVVTGHEGEESQLEMLLSIIKMPYVRSNNNILLSLMRILPFLTFGNKKSMNVLIDHFSPYLDFEKFDKTHSDDELLFLECFCNIADGIENNESGNQLKDIIIDKGILQQAVCYLERHTPSKTFSASNLSDTDLWKDFLARPSLPYILRFLSGMCKGHARSQLSVSETTVPVIHRLEQVSSEEKIGSLAENLMEALKEHPVAKTKVTAVRRETREEKKKLAMAMRQKQLGALGMSATAGGKIITKPSAAIQGFEEISNETGLTCCICREGYKYHPNKVLGIYTYTKRCLLDGYEMKQRKTQGYSTVSHFNIVHYECHVAAIRLARGRDEWESAALQNSNTKCNGLLPIWGPKVSESAFASCLARHNYYIQECTGHLEPTFHNTVHDLRLLLQRFAYEKPFNEDSGGGGRQSNFNIIPYMVHMTLYVMNTARLRSREEKSVNGFVENSPDTWVPSCFEVNGPLFMTVLSLFTYSLEEWKKNRLPFVNRLIILAHARHVAPKGTQKISDVVVKPYDVYKPVLVFFALVNKLHELLKQSVSATSGTNWSQDIAVYIRNHDEEILKICEELLRFYENDILPATSFSEFCDITGLLGEINETKNFIEELLSSLPS